LRKAASTGAAMTAMASLYSVEEAPRAQSVGRCCGDASAQGNGK
jgi:hypothetical protein